MTTSLTISSLSMDIFLRRYYDDNIPLIKQKSIICNILEYVMYTTLIDS